MGHSLWRISFVITLSFSLRLYAVQTVVANYSVKDMHELLWFSVRQNPYVVESIRTRERVLLPPQEGLDINIPEGVRSRTIIFPTLIARQWFAAVVEFYEEDERWVEDLTLYETTGHLNRATRRQLRHHEFTLEHTMFDPDKAASGPIIAQLILQVLGVAKSFDTVTNMRTQHLSFLQRRRELMTTVMDVRVFERNKTDVEAAENDNVRAKVLSAVGIGMPATEH